MVLVAVVLVLAAAAGLLTGGSLGRLGLLPLRRLRLVRSAALAYVAGVLLGSVWAPAQVAALVVTAALAGAFVWLNRGVPGLPLVGLGLAANALVVLVNAAMPVSLQAAERAGIDTASTSVASPPRHEVLDASTRLPWLADVVPLALPGQPQVVSPGDVAVAAGAGLTLYAGLTGRPHLRRRSRPPRAQSMVRDSTRVSDSTTLGSYS